MSCKMSLEEICSMVESSVFDRKSAKIDAKSLAVHLIAFANADGGTLAIGVEDDGEITGIDGMLKTSMNCCERRLIFASRLCRLKPKEYPAKMRRDCPITFS